MSFVLKLIKAMGLLGGAVCVDVRRAAAADGACPKIESSSFLRVTDDLVQFCERECRA